MLKLEFKKIWKLKILLVIAVMGLLFGLIYLDMPLSNFPNGHPAAEQYQVMREWLEKYGMEMDESEYQDALRELKNELGVKDEKADGDALTRYDVEEDGYSQAVASALYEYELRYEELNDKLKENAYTPAEQARIKDIIQNKKRDGILYYQIMGNVMEYWRWASVFIILSVMVLAAHVITKDTLAGIRTLQYSSKCGRKVLKTQFFATVLSAATLTVLEMLIFVAVYAKLGTEQFWNSPINSFYEGDIYWFDLSYGQYVLSILLLTALFAGGAAGIAFFLSCFSRNYISLMLKIIPVFFVLGMLGNKCIAYLFSFKNQLYGLTGVKGIELYAGIIILLLGTALSFAALKYKSKMRDNDTAA